MTCGSISPYEDNGTDGSEKFFNIASEPSLRFVRQTWWDSLLTMYSSSLPSPPTLMPKRQQAANQITSDLRYLLRYPNYWLSFVNVPRFLTIYFDLERRRRMRPSLLPAALAIAAFFVFRGRVWKKKVAGGRLRCVSETSRKVSLKLVSMLAASTKNWHRQLGYAGFLVPSLV